MSSALVPNLISGFLGFIVTLMVLSYWISDNALFRFVVYAFIGISTGYITVIVIQQVIFSNLLLPFFVGTMQEKILLIVPIVLSVLLLFKVSERFEWFGRPVTAFILGVGAAAAIAGAIKGTIIPQVFSTVELFNLRSIKSLSTPSGNVFTGIFTGIGTIVTLAAFQFSIVGKNKENDQPGKLMIAITNVGRVFVAITLGAIFSGILLASLTALVDRIQSLVTFIITLLNINH